MSFKVGMTELHGISDEIMKNPPEGVSYELLSPNRFKKSRLYKSAAKGVLDVVNGSGYDLLEAPLFPIQTKSDWIYTPATYSTALAFDLLGVRTPRGIRKRSMNRLFGSDNFKGLLFKSKFGLTSFENEGFSKESVNFDVDYVYPAISEQPIHKQYNPKRDVKTLIFVGEFVRKGGCAVVDAFEILSKRHSHLRLKIFSNLDHNTVNKELISTYRSKISKNPAIELTYTSRAELLKVHFPESDIYLCPTLQESFGYSILEAMSFGIPTITTNISAIPEIVGTNRDLNIDLNSYTGSGYQVATIPASIQQAMTEKIIESVEKLISDSTLRKDLKETYLSRVERKFSFETRNTKMSKYYGTN